MAKFQKSYKIQFKGISTFETMSERRIFSYIIDAKFIEVKNWSLERLTIMRDVTTNLRKTFFIVECKKNFEDKKDEPKMPPEGRCFSLHSNHASPCLW